MEQEQQLQKDIFIFTFSFVSIFSRSEQVSEYVDNNKEL